MYFKKEIYEPKASSDIEVFKIPLFDRKNNDLNDLIEEFKKCYQDTLRTKKISDLEFKAFFKIPVNDDFICVHLRVESHGCCDRNYETLELFSGDYLCINNEGHCFKLTSEELKDEYRKKEE